MRNIYYTSFSICTVLGNIHNFPHARSMEIPRERRRVAKAKQNFLKKSMELWDGGGGGGGGMCATFGGGMDIFWNHTAV